MKDEILDVKIYSLFPKPKEYFLQPLSYKWGSDTVNFEVKKVDLIETRKNIFFPNFIYFQNFSVSYKSRFFDFVLNFLFYNYDDTSKPIRLQEIDYEIISKKKSTNYYIELFSLHHNIKIDKRIKNSDTIYYSKDGDLQYKIGLNSFDKIFIYNKKQNQFDTIKSFIFKNWLLTKIEFKHSPPFELIR